MANPIEKDVFGAIDWVASISLSNPFEIDDRNEVIALIENDQVYILRSNSISSNSKYETTREDKIKQLIKYLDEMLEFDSKIGTVIDCGVCSNNGCKVCK